MIKKQVKRICLWLNLFSSLTSFNIDVKDTFVEYSLGNSDLQFGYTVSLLNKNKLVVGAPPMAWPNDNLDNGGLYSCDINNKNCKQLNDKREPLAPSSIQHRCFSSPYNESCGVLNTQTVFYFYDPVYTECKPFIPKCRSSVPGKNIFSKEQDCINTCRAEITMRAATAKIRPRMVECKMVFQNMHKHKVLLYKKNPKGRETLYSYGIFPGQIKIGYDICGNLFVAKSAATNEYLYFRTEDNKFDIVLREPKDGSTVSISTMGEARKFLSKKNNVRTGLSLMTLKDEFVSCDPQYSFKYVGPIGRCSVYRSDNSLDYNVYPVERKAASTGYYFWNNYGYSVAGMSLAKAEANPSLFFAGAPNARRAGSIAVLSTKSGRNLGIRDNPLRRKHRGSNSLFGYAVSVGNIDTSNRYTGIGKGDIFGGAPRGANVHGHVLLIHYSGGHNRIHQFEYIQEIRNPDTQIGSYFGSTLCMADLDKDGKDDVLIGAPYFAKVYDEGRVYVYMNKKGRRSSRVEQKTFLEGKGIIGERFGTAIVNVGDINKDGFTDIAIGAPGGDKGSVYIFNGGANGINEKYSQRISASDIPNGASGFGISISGNIDVNGDSYDDIAVGAHMGQKVYIFKSSPVIKLYATQRVNTTSIPPEQKFVNCFGPNGVGYHCVKLEVTLFYKDIGTPDTFDVEVNLNLDVNKVFKRAKLMNTESKSLSSKKSIIVTLRRNVPRKVSQIVYVKVDSYGEKTDIFSPIPLVTTYKAAALQSSCVKGNPCGILAEKKDTKSVLGYEVRCVNSSFCRPYLEVSSSLHFPKPQKTKEIIYGVTRQVTIRSKIKNTAETAYRPNFYLNFHSDFDIDNVKMGDKSLQWDITEIQKTGFKKLSVSLPYTLHLDAEVSVDVHFSIVGHKPSASNHTFFTKATAIGSERRVQKHNSDTINVKTKIETCIRSTASVEPSIIIYRKNSSIPENVNRTAGKIDLTKYGYEVMYTFYVQNSGGNTLDSLIAEVKAIEELDGSTFMCIEHMVVDQVPCKKALTCPQFANFNKNLFAKKRDQIQNLEDASSEVRTIEMKYKTVTCPLNSIEVGQGVTVSLKVIYFTNLLKKLKEKESNFTSSFRVYHHDEKPLQNLYYQRTDCTSFDDITLSFIRGVEETLKDGVPVWVIILSIVIAIFLLLILIGILVKYGFFKRNRAKDISTPLHEKGEVDEFDDDEED